MVMRTKSKCIDKELFFKALADRTRLRLLNLMRDGEVCVCFFVEILKTNQPKISRHLAYLRRAGIVGARRQGPWMHYRIVEPGDESWDEARTAWNLTADQHPAAVVVAASDEDIAETVRFALDNGYGVTAQGTGHGAAALTSQLDGVILIKTHEMRGVEIDPETRTARAQAGALWMDVTVPAQDHGLAALAGSSPDVGVVGYTLGGGLSWLSRTYGVAANSVTAI